MEVVESWCYNKNKKARYQDIKTLPFGLYKIPRLEGQISIENPAFISLFLHSVIEFKFYEMF